MAFEFWLSISQMAGRLEFVGVETHHGLTTLVFFISQNISNHGEHFERRNDGLPTLSAS